MNRDDRRRSAAEMGLEALAVLRRGGRIPPEGQEARIDLLVSQIVNDRGG